MKILYKRKCSPNWQVKYRIPTAMRATLGKLKTYDKWRTTGTPVRAVASQRAPRIYADLIDEVKQEYDRIRAEAPRMAQHPLLQVAVELVEQARRGEYEDGHERVVMEDAIERYLNDNGESAQDVRHARTAARMVSRPDTFMPVSIAAEKHLQDMERRDRLPSSVAKARRMLNEFATWAGDPAVSDVTKKMVGDWIEQRLVPIKKSATTKKTELGYLKAAWSYFVRTCLTNENPWKDMDALVSGSKRGRKRLDKRPWTAEELEKLKLLAEDDPKRTVSIIRLHSGARVEEVCCLRVEDLDLDAGTMAIGHGEDAVKTDSSVRVLPMHPVVRRMVEELLPKATPDGYLFNLDRAGTDLKRGHKLSKNLNLWIRRNVTKDPALTQYTLRHTFAQALRDNGVPLDVIEYCTGHRNQSMLTRHYAMAAGLEQMRNAIRTLDFGF